ncbi:MAG: SDR family oxidoreductase, partial [Deltaproteobacteria bacterium]|nr:SDR family oxidoreductase [Deltaproteobacteria bacterium]
MRLKDKVAIITGAAHGIGRAYARRFAEEGAHVVVADIDAQGGEATTKAIIDSGFSAWSRTTDVRDLNDLQGLMSETVKKFGRVDILLNNAAIYVTQHLWKGPVEELELSEWDRVIEVNLKGVFLCCKAAIPIMKRQKSGKIINIASGTFFSGSGDMPHYTTAKGGVVALTRVMAR